MARTDEPPAEIVDDAWLSALFDGTEDEVAEPARTVSPRAPEPVAAIEIPDSTASSDFEEIDIPRPAAIRPSAPAGPSRPSVKGKERALEPPVDVDGLSDDDLPDDPYSAARSPSPPKRRAATKPTPATKPSESASGSSARPADVEALEAEIRSIDEEIEGLRKLRASLVADRTRLLAATTKAAPASRPQAQLQTLGSSSSSRSAGGSGKTIDYATSRWPWSSELAAKLKSAWGISSFRPQQEAIINASLDGRDIVVVMPTGVRPVCSTEADVAGRQIAHVPAARPHGARHCRRHLPAPRAHDRPGLASPGGRHRGRRPHRHHAAGSAENDPRRPHRVQSLGQEAQGRWRRGVVLE